MQDLTPFTFNAAHVREVATAIGRINTIVGTISNVNDHDFLASDLARLFLIDFNNQIGINAQVLGNGPDGQLVRFLRREPGVFVNRDPQGRGGTPVSVHGDLGIEDLLTFYLQAKKRGRESFLDSVHGWGLQDGPCHVDRAPPPAASRTMC